jgi:putative ABC transport system permease protein
MLRELTSEIGYRLRALFRRNALEQELDEELRFHIEHEAEKYVAEGVPHDDALRRARLAFGGVDRIKDDARDARGVMFVEHLVQDTRYALRGLRARPLFSAVVVATFALGVGVNTAMFGVLDRLMFRAPQFMIDPGTINRVYVQWADADGKRRFERGLSYPNYVDLQKWSRTTSASAAFAYRRMAVGDGDDTKNLAISAVSASYFGFFDAKPVLGRFFTATEDTPPAGENVAVISFAFWQSRYAGRRDALGASLRMGKVLYRVIGVAPNGFDGVSDQRAPVAFIPITAHAASVESKFASDYGWTWVEMLVRRKPGVTVDQANADLTNAFIRSWNANREVEPALPSAETVKAIAVAGPLQLARGPMAGPETKVASWIGGVAFIVLAIACANVANLLLARALRRRREMALRRAIGGTSRRLVQQILTETLVLAILGSIAGLGAAQIASGSLRRLLVATNDEWSVATDGRTIAFAAGITLLIALFAGLLPALHAGRGDLAGSLKAGTREGVYRQSRMRTALLVFQTALSVVLLVGAGLFVRSLREVRSLPMGYDLEHLAYIETAMRGVKLDSIQGQALAARLLAETRAIPGVTNATLVASVPFWSGEGRGMYVDGIDSTSKLGRFQLQAGNPEYFATLGTRILRGRPFTSADRGGTPRVAVVSEGMAKVLWRGDDPIGKCFRIVNRTSSCITVIGVAENTKARSITGENEFMYYLPMAQYLEHVGQPVMLALFARVNGRPEAYVEPLRSALQRVMPPPSYLTVKAFHEIVDPTMQSWTSGARMFLAFGALALALAAIGLYAVIAFAVAQRTQELGVRIALGAQSRDLLRLMIGEGVRVTIAGVIIGTGIALLAGNGLGDLLYKVSPRDPFVYAAVCVMLVVVGMLASAIPAVRATQVDPNVALRAE